MGQIGNLDPPDLFPAQIFLLAEFTRHMELQCIKGSFYKANGKVMWCCSLDQPPKKARKIRAGRESSLWQLWKLSLWVQPEQMLQLNSIHPLQTACSSNAASEFWVIFGWPNHGWLPVCVNHCFIVSCLCRRSDAFHLEFPLWSQRGGKGAFFFIGAFTSCPFLFGFSWQALLHPLEFLVLTHFDSIASFSLFWSLIFLRDTSLSAWDDSLKAQS